MPEDIRVESLNDDQMRDLNRLNVWLYQKRTTVRLGREAGRRKEAQPSTICHGTERLLPISTAHFKLLLPGDKVLHERWTKKDDAMPRGTRV